MIYDATMHAGMKMQSHDIDTKQPEPLMTRFAPSPTGYLHLGHCLSAIFVWGVARALGAKVILRMEDHDLSRSRKHFEEEILKDLDWLGFHADLGLDPSQRNSPFRQSDQRLRYDAVLSDLSKRGFCYGCTCTRKQIQERSSFANEELYYNGICKNKHLALTTNIGIRLQTPDSVISFHDLWLGKQTQNPAMQCGDFLVRDRLNQYTYQFCVAVDDKDQNINLIIRGQDLTASTARQIYLKTHLGQDGEKIRYLHHPLINNSDGQKLSKRFQSESLATYRNDGTGPDKILRWACEQSRIEKLEKARDRQEISAYFDILAENFNW